MTTIQSVYVGIDANAQDEYFPINMQGHGWRFTIQSKPEKRLVMCGQIPSLETIITAAKYANWPAWFPEIIEVMMHVAEQEPML